MNLSAQNEGRSKHAIIRFKRGAINAAHFTHGFAHKARGRLAGIIVNGGALSHYGWSLHDALAAYAHLCQAWAWTASARACAQLLAQAPEDTQARARLERMRYGVQWLLPQAQVHWQALRAAPPLPLEVG